MNVEIKVGDGVPEEKAGSSLTNPDRETDSIFPGPLDRKVLFGAKNKGEKKPITEKETYESIEFSTELL